MRYSILYKVTTYPNNPYIQSAYCSPKKQDAIKDARELNELAPRLEHVVADDKGTIVWTPRHDKVTIIDIRDKCKEAF